MDELRLFETPEFGKVRTLSVNNEPYFMLADICRVLEIGNSSQAKTRLKKDGLISNEVIDSLGRLQQADFINESNLYKLVFQSRKPQAEKFGDWVTDEVLPSIRKTGSYSLQPQLPTTYLEALEALVESEKIKQQQATQIQELKPKAEFYNAVVDSETAIDMGSVAKVLNMGIGRNKLFQILRDKKVLQGNNQPYQLYIDRGYFRCIESSYTKPNGDTCVNIKTVVFQKGVDFIRKMIEKEK